LIINDKNLTSRTFFIIPAHIILVIVSLVLLFTQPLLSALPENVFKISSYPGKGRSPVGGFGFIVYEDNNVLYAVTARHVIWDKKHDKQMEKIDVSFKNLEGKYQAELLRHDEDLDLALLKFFRPSDHNWHYRAKIHEVHLGDKVWSMGRNLGLLEPTPQAYGKVISVTDKMITAEFYAAVIGCSGGPLLLSNKFLIESPLFAGMIIEDEGEKIYALPIGLIMEKVSDWLSIRTRHIKDLPTFHVGIGGNTQMSFFNEFPYEFYQAGNQKTGINYTFSLFTEVALLDRYSLRLSGGTGRLVSETRTDYLPDYKFRNNFNELSLSGYYHPLTMQYEMTGFFFGRVSLVFIDPQVNLENSGWQKLSEVENTTHEYNETIMAAAVGFGFNVYFYNECFVGVEMGYKQFQCNTMYINITDPLRSSSGNDWLIFVDINVGLSIRPSNSNIRLLRK
jgi:hypothetical protein